MTLPWQQKLLRDTSVGQAPGRKPKHTCYSVTVVSDGITAWVERGCLCVCKRESTVKKETETERGKGNGALGQ